MSDIPNSGGVQPACLEPVVRHSVVWTVEDMIAKYPDLFPSRTQALHHLFVVLGCGYEWENGKLVEQYDDGAADRLPRAEARRLATLRTPLGRAPYPYYDRCNLGLLPPDAAPDWRAAAEEARADMSNKKAEGTAQ